MTADNLTFALEIDFIPDLQEGRDDFKKKMKSVAYWTKHPMSREECLNQFKRLREQRLSRESKLQISKDSQETEVAG